MQKDIIQNWFFQHPVEAVWESLVNPELLSQWLMENDFKAKVGHKFTFYTKPRVKIGFDGIVYCEVLEIVPMKLLSYSWKGGPGNGKLTLDSIVTWKLNKKGEGTELTLEHKGFKGFNNFIPYLIMSKGWKDNIRRRLQRVLNTQTNETSNN